MHDTTHDDEREAARPNDAVRAELLAALDIADRAGVQLSAISAFCYLGKVSSIDLHGTTADMSRMRHTDALRIALRAARRSGEVQVSDPIDRGATTRPYVRVAVQVEGGPKVTCYAEPSPAQVADLKVEAVLQS